MLHLSTYLVVMSLSIEIFTNSSCTLILVLLLVARWSGIASLKKYVVVILYIYYSVSIERTSLSLSFSSIKPHSNGLTF